jgi:hypothetical protein
MDVSGQLHALTTLSPAKKVVTIEEEDGWTPEVGLEPRTVRYSVYRLRYPGSGHEQ